MKGERSSLCQSDSLRISGREELLGEFNDMLGERVVPILLFGGFVVCMTGFAALLYAAYYLQSGISIQQGAGYAILLGIFIIIIGGVLSRARSLLASSNQNDD